MTDEDAIHFHRLCELRGELVKMKEERDDLQTINNILEKDCDQYRERLKELETELRELKREKIGYEKDPFG